MRSCPAVGNRPVIGVRNIRQLSNEKVAKECVRRRVGKPELPARMPFFTYRALLAPLCSMAAMTALSANAADEITTVDLSRYIRVGRHALPEPILTPLPAGASAQNVLCQEASGVAYNWDTDTLFIVGDGGRSVTQVSKTGQLIDTMNLAAGSSPQGTDFYDPEGITYVGGGQFVFSEERDRQLVKFTYAAGTTLSRSGAKTVRLGTFADNKGIEGMSFDPLTGGFICMKEIDPLGVFHTLIDFDAGTATNGSPSTVNSVNLFDPALMGMSDFADVFALSNLPSMAGQPQEGNLLVLSQEAARIVNTDRDGNILSTLQIVADAGSPLSVAEQQHEGLTMDRSGNIYVVNENGGGNIDHPELWVYAPSSAPNLAPTAVTITNPVNTVVENASTVVPFKVGNIVVTDEGLGTNTLTLSGPDAAFFEISNLSLYLKAGTVIDFETKTSYHVTVQVDDATVGTTPDASTTFTLTVTDIVNEGAGGAIAFISEVHPSGSGNNSYSADWFEVTNPGTTDLNISGWQVDDSSDGSTKITLRGVTVIPAGKSAVFFEGLANASTDPAILAKFSTAWFGTATPPAGLLIGSYGGSGIGLSTGGDSVNLFDAAGNRVAGVSFGSATTGVTFDNKIALGSTSLPLPLITARSSAALNGAFVSADGSETGSPGTIGGPSVIISEIHPTGSGNSAYGADWFEITNTGTIAVNISGWQMDDNTNGSGKVALRGVASLPVGKSAIFLEGTAAGTTDASLIASFSNAWFGTTTPPAGLLIGAYGGSGIGLSSDGDSVNLFNAAGDRIAGVSFGGATDNVTFDNKAGLGGTTLPFPTIVAKSAVGVNGAFSSGGSGEIGSPGITGRLIISEVAPWGSSTSYGADWFEVLNDSAVTLNLSGWKVDDSSESPAGAVALNGITNLAPGERAIFLETATPSTTIPDFTTAWFGANPPTGLKVGSYSGSGVELDATTGDAVNLYEGLVRQANVSFGASASAAPFTTFDNAAGVSFGGITRFSVPAVNGAFVAKNDAGQIGSPGTLANGAPLDFNLWLAANGFTSAGFGIDSNQNGLLDGVDFFFNLKRGDRSHLPVVTTSGGGKLLTFTTLDGAAGVTGLLECSADLGVSEPWAAAILHVDYEVVGATAAAGQTTTTLRLLGTAATKFWRHRVTQN